MARSASSLLNTLSLSFVDYFPAWTETVSIRRPSRFQRNALPTELSVLICGSGWIRTNNGKCRRCYRPLSVHSLTTPILWRRSDLNRQPVACKATALPIELRPRTCYCLSAIRSSAIAIFAIATAIDPATAQKTNSAPIAVPYSSGKRNSISPAFLFID